MTAAGSLVHLAAGGSGSLPWAAVCGVLLLGPAWLLTGRERGWLALAGAQLAGQQAVHVLLGHGTGHGATPAAELMVYGHVAVAAVIAVWLRHGERRAWVAARRAAAAVAAGLRVLLALFGLPAGLPPVDVPTVAGPEQRSSALLRHAVVRRGPPAAA